MSTERGWRPFWLHQAAEYLVALVLVASGLQSTAPLWPTLAGGLVLANAAVSGPPLGAFRLVPRSLHAKVDLGVVAALVVVAVLPFLDIDSASRATIVVVAVVLAVVWWGTNFADVGSRRRRPVAPASSFDSETLGRAAGRLYAKAGKAVRKRPE